MRLDSSNDQRVIVASFSPTAGSGGSDTRKNDRRQFDLNEDEDVTL